MGSFDELEQIREQALVDLTGASTTAALEAWEDRYLGRKGEITLRARTWASYLRRTARPLANA